MQEEIVNKVSQSALVTLDLESFFPTEDILIFDLKPFLFMELILKEKDFRAALSTTDWSVYSNKIVGVYCSADAVIPVWAYMLVTSYLQPFAKEVIMASASRNREGNPVLKRENSIHDFAKQVASQKPGALSEEIWGLKIQVDGDFAQAWCDYAFYYENKFNHCGADAFHLFKTKEGWKIFHLADTRRKDGCNVPEEIKKKHP